MNEYVESAKKVVESATKKVIKKSGDIYSTTKLYFQISKLKGEVDECYKKIGKLFYASYRGDEASGDEADMLCKQIDEINEHIDLISAQISEIKDVIICQNCGAEVKKGSQYCAKCGAEI